MELKISKAFELELSIVLEFAIWMLMVYLSEFVFESVSE